MWHNTGCQMAWASRHTIIVLYHDFLIWNKHQAGSYSHLHNKLCLISIFRTVHHRSPFREKKFSPHIPKLILQKTFLYYPPINCYDLQNVSSLQGCNTNFKIIWHPKPNTKKEIVKCNLTIWWPYKAETCCFTSNLKNIHLLYKIWVVFLTTLPPIYALHVLDALCVHHQEHYKL